MSVKVGTENYFTSIRNWIVKEKEEIDFLKKARKSNRKKIIVAVMAALAMLLLVVIISNCFIQKRNLTT